MKAKEKRMILILVVITIIMFVILMIVRNSNKNNEQEGTQQNSSFIAESNGTKQNTSNKLQEAKKVVDLDVTNIQITEVNGQATIRANIENNTSSNKKEFPITVMLYNEKRELLQKVGAYVGNIKVGETRAINASVNMDITTIYDIEFEK